MGMGPIVWTCLALTVHQGPVQEYFMSSRAFKLPIKLDPKKAGELQSLTLLVSRDKGKTWEQWERKAPNEREFVYHAPDDGSYWFIVQQEDRAGRTNPSNPERAKPSMAMIVDTAPPQIRVTAERLPNGQVRAHWTASDAYPDPRSLRLYFRTPALADWTPVLPASLVHEGSHDFEVGNEGKTGEVRVRVQMKDQAGNVGENVYVLHAAATSIAGTPAGPGEGQPTIGLIPTIRSDPSGQPNQLASRQTQRPHIEAPPGGMVVPPPSLSPSPAAQLNGPNPHPAPFGGSPIASSMGQAPRQPQVLTGEMPISPPPGPAGIPSEAPANFPAVKVVKARQVRIDFTVGQVGPSGLGNADVYVSLDRGQNWTKMPGGDVPITLSPSADLRAPEVAASVGVELRAEGTIYGFIVAAKSKAGLAPPPPRRGDPPQALVEWDKTEPKGQLFRPQPDPTQPSTLLLAWKAEDRNLGERPITLEWAEQKDGPWSIIGEPQLPNTGQYPWRLPERLPPRVYLRLTMRDVAGNESRAQTDKPELIDLSVPQTRITGVAPASR